VRFLAVEAAAECGTIVLLVGGGPFSAADSAKLGEEEAQVLLEAEIALSHARRLAAAQIAEESAAKLAGKDGKGGLPASKRASIGAAALSAGVSRLGGLGAPSAGASAAARKPAMPAVAATFPARAATRGVSQELTVPISARPAVGASIGLRRGSSGDMQPMARVAVAGPSSTLTTVRRATGPPPTTLPRK
jgi:hypothetical protein